MGIPNGHYSVSQTKGRLAHHFRTSGQPSLIHSGPIIYSALNFRRTLSRHNRNGLVGKTENLAAVKPLRLILLSRSNASRLKGSEGGKVEYRDSVEVSRTISHSQEDVAMCKCQCRLLGSAVWLIS